MNRKVQSAIKKYDLLKAGQNVLCAVSGGADSMAMLVLLSELKTRLSIKVAAAHLNHLIRGEEADRDEAYVRDFCALSGIPFYSERIDIKNKAKIMKKGIEEAARIARYAFFERAREALLCDLIATAHTANDNLETILLNIMRGTGIMGLCGIPPKRGRIIRPLIDVSRDEAEAYLRKKGVGYMTDSSNFSEDFLRNKIRIDIIPQMIKARPAVVKTARTMADMLRLDSDFIMAEARKLAAHAVRNEKGIMIKAELLSGSHPAAAGRVLRLLFEELTGDGGCLGSKHVFEVLRLCMQSHPSKRVSLPRNITAERHGGELFLSNMESMPKEIKEIPLLSEGKYDIYEAGCFAEYRKAQKNLKIYNLAQTFLIDCDKITGCLVIRSRREGDKLKLPGRRTKTLKKLFIEEKIPVSERILIPVVADNERVVAVYGFGTDSNYLALNLEKALYLHIGRVEESNEG